MKQLYNLIEKKLRDWYYFQEFKELGLLFFIGIIITLVYEYGSISLHWLFTFKGVVYLCFFMVSIVLGISIKTFYRIIAIKYYEKDTNLVIFENIENEK